MVALEPEEDIRIQGQVARELEFWVEESTQKLIEVNGI